MRNIPLNTPCGCKFVAVGKALDNSGCVIHPNSAYPCPETKCENYRPAKVKLGPRHWPLCVCGEIAQAHN